MDGHSSSSSREWAFWFFIGGCEFDPAPAAATTTDDDDYYYLTSKTSSPDFSLVIFFFDRRLWRKTVVTSLEVFCFFVGFGGSCSIPFHSTKASVSMYVESTILYQCSSGYGLFAVDVVVCLFVCCRCLFVVVCLFCLFLSNAAFGNVNVVAAASSSN